MTPLPLSFCERGICSDSLGRVRHGTVLVTFEISLHGVLETGAVEDRHDDVSADTCAMQEEVEALPTEIDVETIGELRGTLADEGHIIGSDFAVAADIPDDRVSVGIHAVIDIAEEVPHRVTGLESGTYLIVGTAGRVGSLTGCTSCQLKDSVVQSGEVGVDAVVEITDGVSPSEFELPSAVEHAATVDGGGGGAKLRRRGDAEEEVLRLLEEDPVWSTSY